MEGQRPVLKYALQQEETTGRWVIVCVSDPSLVWQGRCWIGRDQRGAHLTFASSEEAEEYAAGVFK